jgi:hypothetical protein
MENLPIFPHRLPIDLIQIGSGIEHLETKQIHIVHSVDVAGGTLMASGPHREANVPFATNKPAEIAPMSEIVPVKYKFVTIDESVK